MDYFRDLSENVSGALEEDIRDGDITAQIIDEKTIAVARVISRQSAIICGGPWVEEVARQIDPKLKIEWQVRDGDEVNQNDLLFAVHGKARSILSAERTMLNSQLR